MNSPIIIRFDTNKKRDGLNDKYDLRLALHLSFLHSRFTNVLVEYLTLE